VSKRLHRALMELRDKAPNEVDAFETGVMCNALRRLARICAAIAGTVKTAMRLDDESAEFHTPPESITDRTDSSKSRTPPFLTWSEIDSDWGDDDDLSVGPLR